MEATECSGCGGGLAGLRDAGGGDFSAAVGLHAIAGACWFVLRQQPKCCIFTALGAIFLGTLKFLSKFYK